MAEPQPSSLHDRLRGFTAAVAVLLLAFVGVVAALGVLVRDAEQDVTVRLFDAVRYAEGSRAALIDQETALRGYLLTGQDDFLEPYTQGVAEQRAADEGIRAALADEPVLREHFARTVATGRAWQETYAVPTLELVERSGTGAVDEASSEEGKALFDAFRAQFEDFRVELLDTRQAAVQRLDRLLVGLGVAVAAGVLGVLVAGLLLTISLRRWVTRPLEDLSAQTRLVAGGDFARRVEPGGPSEIVAVGEDVEAMRARIVEDLATVANSRIELEVANEQLESQTAELQRSNSDLEQFAYVASHDLQEPLRKISSFTQLLQKRYGGQLDERADQYIGFAVDGAKRMQVLINDLLAFSRVGRFQTELRPLDLDESLDEALRSLTTALEESDAVIDREDLPEVLGEVTLLTQVFQNLVGNALKFRGEDPPVVRVRAQQDGDEWVVTVADNGIGIDPQFADKVFVIFQRLHGREAYEGTGIGLALSRRIVEYHGGRIWLEPAAPEHRGATFAFTLPVMQSAPETDAVRPGGTT